jgi:cell division protein FtsW (lipid II flippase)
MANSVYTINKGINKPVEFKGLKAQYIWYLGGGLLILLILFAILYIAGIPSWICIVIVAAGGTGLFVKVYQLSRQYGEHGLMKKAARKGIPEVLRLKSRRIFMQAAKGK